MQDIYIISGRRRRRNQIFMRLHYLYSHTLYNIVKLVLCIQPIPKEQCASTAWQPGTNSSSGPAPRSRALAGEITDYICLMEGGETTSLLGNPHNLRRTCKARDSNPSGCEASVLTAEPTCCRYSRYFRCSGDLAVF